jgi:hypothetical protein
LNAHYTSPTVIKAIYEAFGNMASRLATFSNRQWASATSSGYFPTTWREVSCTVLELDSITGRIAKQLYPKADITVAGFETTDSATSSIWQSATYPLDNIRSMTGL